VAFAESSAGKKECGQFNPFGWGNPCWDFIDYPTAIRAVANSISSSPTYRRYQETHDLAELARVYNAADVEAWIATVAGYQKRIREFN
jgi:hypothetical protein